MYPLAVDDSVTTDHVAVGAAPLGHGCGSNCVTIDLVDVLKDALAEVPRGEGSCYLHHISGLHGTHPLPELERVKLGDLPESLTANRL